MGCIAVLLAIVVVFLAVRLFILRREIVRISNDLQELNTGMTNGKLTVAMLHKPLEHLCRQINLGLEIRDKARIDTENHEAELRAQISNISHDLRTPLTAIMGYISMMKSAPEKAERYLEIIEGRSKALQALVEQFYELSVLEDSRTELMLEPVDITAALTNCLLGNYALFEAKGIQPESHLPEQAITVISNTQTLERIFQNLIHNALKFAKVGISISLLDKGIHCIFTISNDAENITEADLDYLFEQFYTADKSRSAGNTGLGLYIVKRLLEKTRGSVSDVKLENGWFTVEILFAKSGMEYMRSSEY